MKPHLVGPKLDLKEICGPADIEAHEGKDKRYYVLDTARLFPPEAPYRTVVVLKLPAGTKSEKKNFFFYV
jgi:hypothetical protein